MCDHYLGKVMDLMDVLKLWDDTMLIVCTDHGFLLGEHDWWAKSAMPWYDELIHTPLFIWDPRNPVPGARRQSLVQTIDLAPTILDFFGIEPRTSMDGVPLAETIATDQRAREGGLFGIHGGHVNVTDGRYVYMRAPKDPSNKPLYEYTLMPTHMRSRFGVRELQDIQLQEPFSFTQGCRTMKIEGRSMMNPHSFGTMLFDLQSDPGQENPIVDEAVERRMIRLMVQLMRENDAPREQFERLGLPADGEAREEHLLLQAQHAISLKAMAPRPSPEDIESGEGYYNLDTPLKELLADQGAHAVVARHIPQMIGGPQLEMVKNLSLKQIAQFAPAIFTVDVLRAVAASLAQVSPGGDHVGVETMST
jgi:hypothetical protein